MALLDNENISNLKWQDERFNEYLEKVMPEWKELGDVDKRRNNPSEYWPKMDRFAEAIENFGKESYNNGRRVICEGIQIAEPYLRTDRSFYKNKPLIIMGANTKKSMTQAWKRIGQNGKVGKEYYN